MPASAMVRAQRAVRRATLTMGLARSATLLYRGDDPAPLHHTLAERLARDPDDAAALMDLSTLLQLSGKPEEGLACQARALAHEQCFHLPAPASRTAHIRLLMFAVPGDLMANTPVEFLLDGMPVSLDTVYLQPGAPIPTDVPEHDVALVGIAESAENRTALMRLAPILATWPRPVLNMPARIGDLARERLFEVLAGCPGLDIPATARIDRATLHAVAHNETPLASVLPDAAYPVIVRPAGSHAGNGLEKLDGPGELAAYLAKQSSEEFYLSRFVDYSSADGQFRKYRIVCIGGRPYLAHMAIARHWMLHYLNAGMHEDAAKRAEEARAMAEFDRAFGARHALALRRMAHLLDLDYFAIDCAETREGNLLVFEAGTAMIVHGMDPPDLFPYKQAQIARISDAFVEMLAFRICDAAIRAHMR